MNLPHDESRPLRSKIRNSRKTVFRSFHPSRVIKTETTNYLTLASSGLKETHRLCNESSTENFVLFFLRNIDATRVRLSKCPNNLTPGRFCPLKRKNVKRYVFSSTRGPRTERGVHPARSRISNLSGERVKSALNPLGYKIAKAKSIDVHAYEAVNRFARWVPVEYASRTSPSVFIMHQFYDRSRITAVGLCQPFPLTNQARLSYAICQITLSPGRIDAWSQPTQAICFHFC